MGGISFKTTQAPAVALVLGIGACRLLDCYVTTGTAAGYMMVFDAATAPGDGAVSPVHCIACPANSTTSLDLPSATPEPYANGIVVVFSSTGPFTKTGSAAFIKGIAA